MFEFLWCRKPETVCLELIQFQAITIVNLLMTTHNVELYFLVMSSFIINKLKYICSTKSYINAEVTVQMIHICRMKITAWSNLSHFARNNHFFYSIDSCFRIKTGYILIDFDVIFSIQISGFIKSLNFGSNLKKTARKNLKIFIFHIKINFYGWKNIFSM